MSPTRPPKYRHHKPTGQAVVTIRTPDGVRKDKYLGRWKSPESKAAYARVIGELAVAPTAIANPGDQVTVNEILVAFLRHAKVYYRRKDGTPTSELENFVLSMRPVRKLYGYTPAAKFDVPHLEAIRQHYIDSGLCRRVVNQRTGRVVRIFRWAAAKRFVPATVYAALAVVEPLKEGRSQARETDPVGPVADDAVTATLPFLLRPVRGLVKFQQLTGCRPGEATSLRRCDIDSTGPEWVYRPPHHKLAHRRKDRVIILGPRVRALLDEYPTDDPTDYIFSPARGMAELRAERAAARQTPRWPSHLARNVRKRKRRPANVPYGKYVRTSYASAIARGVEKANARREKLAGRGNYDPVPRWRPNQLRHAHATKVRKLFGLEAVQVALGHARADVTQVYAERDVALASRVAKAVG
jgi:integrase